jgi:hypothetical protein
MFQGSGNDVYTIDEMVTLRGNNLEPPMSALGQKQTRTLRAVQFVRSKKKGKLKPNLRRRANADATPSG